MHISRNVFKSVGWLTLAHLLGLYTLIVLIPFFSQGIYRMSVYDVQSSSIETYGRSSLPWVLSTVLGIPLLGVLTVVLIRDWNLSAGYRKFAKLSVLVLATLLLVVHVAFYQVIGAWVLD